MRWIFSDSVSSPMGVVARSDLQSASEGDLFLTFADVCVKFRSGVRKRVINRSDEAGVRVIPTNLG